MLDLLIRFWELQARHASAGEPLDAREQIELLSLMQLVTGDVELPPPGTLSTQTFSIPGQLIGDGSVVHADIRRVSAGGLLVSAKIRVKAGARFLVKTADAIMGVEYTLPCTVVWAHGREPTSLALALDGIPTRATFGETVDAPRAMRELAPSISMGRAVRLVG
jgi:PilZ domain